MKTLQSLELKLPPLLVALAVAAAMRAVAMFMPGHPAPSDLNLYASIALVLGGIVLSLAGIISFGRARTTVNPLKPDSATSLVSSGIYRVTRNPMYVGLLLVLAGWAVFLFSPWTLFGPPLFIFYINRFQITPEERALSVLFGHEYDAYRSRVRRWL
ncbi:MAG: isoprenylcysteine carboxylmethyltransferase family protein [Chlorobiaceae bacterium]